MKKIILLIISHLGVAAFGFALGIYALPILTAPEAPADSEIREMAASAQYTAEFKKDLTDSDAFHWGEGTVSINKTSVSLMGELAPGPDYKLYFSPAFVETEDDFNKLKSSMVQAADVKTFENFLVSIPESINPADYNTVIVWCESFGEFITAAKYQ